MAYGTVLHIFQHRASATLQFSSWRTILHPHISSLFQTHLRKHNMTCKHALTQAHMGTVSLTHTHTGNSLCIHRDAGKFTGQLIYTPTRGSHTE